MDETFFSNRGRILLAVLVTFAFFVLAESINAMSSKKALNGAQKLSDRLSEDLNPEELYQVANSIGPFVDAIRANNSSILTLEKMKSILNVMREKSAARVEAIELSKGDSEGRLEALYRSQAWDDMSFSLAAFPYWRAWIDLELARKKKNKGLMGAEKTTALLPAEKGFRAASLQFYRPGLVYGGWLGLGYVELAKGRFDRARLIFESLDSALTEEDSPIKSVVKDELRLLDARSGTIAKLSQTEKLTQEKAQIIRLEAFALLKESKASGGRPVEAAKRLNLLVRTGFVDQALVDDMMFYAQQIASVKIGYYTELAGAEFALKNGHHYNAMQKYQLFFSNNIAPRAVNFSNYRYKWALSAYQAKIYQPAITILEKLERKKDLSDELDKATAKLLYAVYAAKEANNSSPANKRKLRLAAKKFVRKSPADPDADSARLVIAQTTSNAKSALNSLKDISSGELRTDVGRTAFTILAKEFSNNVRRSKIARAKALANDGIRAFSSLPKSDKANTFYFSVFLQMRALVDPDPKSVLDAIEIIESRNPKNLDIKRALVWSRLQIYGRTDFLFVEKYIRQLALASGGIPSWQIEFLYPFVASVKDSKKRERLALLLLPSVLSQPDLEKRVRGTIIGALLESKSYQEAYDRAKIFTKEYSSSGDAWRFLGKSAEKVGKPYEADRAWGVITKKAIPTQEVWWEGMISRARIRSAERADQACNLVRKMERTQDYLPKKFKTEYNDVRSALRCGEV